MRITTQMLNESARRAGLPINNTSLLNYINGNSSENTLLSALNKSSTVDSAKKSNYEKLEKAADELSQNVNFFTAEGEKSVFAKARESENNEEIYDGVEALVESYNNTINYLKTDSSSLNIYYRQMLQEAAIGNKEALSSVGITISKDGTLEIDKDKLEAADTDSLENVLGKSGTFSGKVEILAARIADNAEANAESLSSQYSSTGSLYSALGSKYDFWG